MKQSSCNFSPLICFLLLSLSQCKADRGAALVPTVVPSIVTAIPHDPQAFTQGLLYHGGYLYESTGLHGHSSLRKIDAVSGKASKIIAVPGVFAEGLALLDNQLVQLTWQEQLAIVYGIGDLRARGTFTYDGEGWGLTSDSSDFIMSNGSDTLFFRDRQFKLTRRLPVTFEGRPLRRINELEYVAGKIYANVWYSDLIFEISPKNGMVLRKINCAGLVKREQPLEESAVLNGIAYNAQENLFYLTGKNWRTIYVVRIPDETRQRK